MSLATVKKRIALACERVGRDPSEVKLIAVTKGHDVAEIQSGLLAHGHAVLGENRIQEWRAKQPHLAEVEWHFIGNLQTNKVKYCSRFHTLHSLNRERLADALEAYGEKTGHTFRVMLEVNIAGESSKQGAEAGEVHELLRYAASLPHVEVRGLMTIAPYSPEPERARPVFKALRQLRDKLGVEELSMGMSGDFEIAIEEGATQLRIGSALFENR